MSSQILDLVGFTERLAKELGVSYPEQPKDYVQRFALFDDALEVSARNGFGANGKRVTLNTSSPLDAKLEHHKRQKFERITVSGERDIAAVARDYRRRVLGDAEAKIAAAKAAVAENDRIKQAVSDRCKEWEKRFPGVSCKPSHDGLSASIYFNDRDRYLSGSIENSGRINIQRLSLDGEATSVRLLALLAGEECV